MKNHQSKQKNDYPGNPRVAVGAVVFKDECVLLVRRGQPPSEDLWAIPGGSVEIKVPYHRPGLTPGTEYWLSLWFTLQEGNTLLEKGQEVAWAQFIMPFEVQH